jgi:hypothetical protein
MSDGTEGQYNSSWKEKSLEHHHCMINGTYFHSVSTVTGKILSEEII